MQDPLKTEQDLVDALRLTAAPPPAWTEAAALIPEILGDLGGLERLTQSEEFRRRFETDPGQALAEAGLRPNPVLVSALRERLDD